MVTKPQTVRLRLERGVRAFRAALLLAAYCGASALSLTRASDTDEASLAATRNERALMMQRFMVSAARVDRNPWHFATVSHFEILTRASDEDTAWWLDSIERGLMIEDQIVPRDWLPDSPVPNTLIIDDTDLDTVPNSQLRSQPIRFHAPSDALTWGNLSGKANIWNDRFEAHDHDTYSINSDVHGADTKTPACVIGLGRVTHCAPPLPDWVLEGLLSADFGVFRESFMPVIDVHREGWITGAVGPGTLWVSLDATQRLLKTLKADKNAKIAMPPLRALFEEMPASPGDRALWMSEAALFVRWGILGPGREDPALSRAFLEFVRCARREPVTEKLFTDCFGFGYPAMEKRLESFLKTALARPTSVDLNISPNFPGLDLTKATADQIGRVLGDWLRMQGDSLRATDPGMSREFLGSAGRMLERAYRDDNGLPPDVDPNLRADPSAVGRGSPAKETIVVMKPFVVSATKIHDPKLLSVYGLFECDVGNDAKARELLEAAARQGVVRSGTYLALAGIRYKQAMAKPEGRGGRLSAQQAASVLGPLDTALRSPPSPETYRLIVETWEHCEAKPTRDAMAPVVEGVSLYPRYTSLAYHSALLCAQSGFPDLAAKLVDGGALFATGEGSRRQLEQLRGQLQLPATSDRR